MSDVVPELETQEPAEEAARDEALDTLWKLALAEWNEPKRHAALLELALGTNRLPDLAGRYRALKDDPEKGALAKKRLDAIVVAATQMLMATASSRTKAKTPPVVLALAGVLFFAALIWIARVLLKLHR